MSYLIKIMCGMMAASCLVMAIVARVPAQSPNDDAEHECGPAADLALKPCESETEAPESALVIVEALRQPAQSGEVRLPLLQISKDIRYLQAVTNYLSRTASQSSALLDFKAITRSATEKSERAARLQDSLALPDSAKRDKEENPPADAEQLRVALLALSARISDAVRNPVLRGYSLDATGAAKAGGELSEIIRMSKHIKLSSEILGNAKR
jgi:hypothetical protein